MITRLQRGFTIIELLVVMAVITVLAALILSTSGYVQKKGARSRAEAEIAAMSAACESYKADNGTYPRDANTDALAAVRDLAYQTKNPADPNPSSYDPNAAVYKSASFSLYAQLSGNTNGDRITFTQKSYMSFKPNMLAPTGGTGVVTAVTDPFGNSYGYSTAQAAYVQDATKPNYGFNPTFDFWSTASTTNPTDALYESKWIKNW